MTSSFAELGLSAKVLAAIEAAGYPSPTPIQAQAIPVATTGRDVLGIAQTGTGKTASFVLPMITRLESGRARARMPRSLILAPTRELAAQVAQSFEKYGVNHKLSVALLIGGVSMDDQLQKLDRGVDVLIATPGRLLDHFGRGKLMLMGVEILVIDEADRMLDMGFIPDIEKICKLLPPKRQTLFFSATMPPEITRLVDQFLKDPARIEVARPATTAKTITQRFSYCPSSEDWAKREVLRELIRSLDVKNAIIFCNRKRDVAILLKSLTKHGFNAGALHGDMDQMSRMATLDKFRSGEITLLAASDVAARGLDIPDVSHVFNFDVPWQPDDYVHRIGRTGRAGKEGFSATIVTPEDVKSMEAIAKLIGEETVWLGEIPDEATLAEGRMKKRGRGGRGGRPGGDQRGGRGRSDMRHGAKFGGGGRGDRPERRPRPERQERPERIHEPRGEHRVDHLDAPPAPSSRPQFGRPVQERAEGRSERFDRTDRPERSRRRDEETGHRDDQGRDRPSHISHGDRGWDETRDAPRRDRERDHDARDDRGYEPRTRARHRDESRTSEPRPAAPRDRFERDEPRYREYRPGRSERDSRDGHSTSRGGDHRDARRDRPAREEPAEHRDRPHRRDRERTGPPHGDRGHEEPPRPQQHRDRSPPQRDRAGRERDNGGQGTGLGEHVPAFLRRPVRASAD